MNQRCYFVYGKFQKKDNELQMGVWEDIKYIGHSFKTWGWRNNMFHNNLGDVEYVRVVGKESQQMGDERVFFEQIYNQRDMRTLSKDWRDFVFQSKV